MRPLLLIVTGHPATGKSTLAGYLSRKLSIPVLAKDPIKETLWDALGGQGPEESRRLGGAAIELIFAVAGSLLRAGSSVILESPLNPHFANDQIAALETEHGCQTLQIVAMADPDTIAKRYADRAGSAGRHPCHLDGQRVEDIAVMARQPYIPPSISGARLYVDTTSWDDVNCDSILGWVVANAALANSPANRATTNSEGDTSPSTEDQPIRG